MDNYIGEIKLFPIGFVPQGWMACNGQLLQIAQYSALYSLLGVNYGGDGRTTFGLPNLQGRVAVGAGSGPGLTARKPGNAGGSATASLSITQLPAHDHLVNVAPDAADSSDPTGRAFATAAGLYGPADKLVVNSSSIALSGSQQPHNNMQPYIALQYCISVDGIYPVRS